MRVAGFGFRGKATVASLADAYERAGGEAGLFATAARKVDSPALRVLAEKAGVRLVAIGDADLAAQVVLTHSARVKARFGAGSVAEAAALAAAGSGGRLIGPRVVSGDGLATAAIAERTEE